MNTFLAKQIVRYYVTSGHKFGHRVHSPFVFELIQSVFRAKNSQSTFSKIEKRRKELLRDATEITIQDFGAGSKRNTSNTRKINYIARTSLSQGKYARLLYNLIQHFKPKTILELGTSLGISSAYMAYGNPDANVVSLEGSETIAEIARKTMHSCEIENVEIVVGNFDDTLAGVLSKLHPVDFAFVDGNHTKEATLRYFNQICEYRSSQTVMIFDDISWSEGMREAWNTIKDDKRVSISIDLCKFGIVFFRDGIVKQNFVIRY